MQPKESDSRYWSINPDSVTAPPQVQYNPDGTRSVSAPSPVDDYYKGLYQSPEDAQRKTEETKADFNRRLQDQIYAIDEAYAPIYQQAAREAEGRLGSTATINALSGQRGAPSGAANTEKTTAYNSEIRQSIDARKSSELAAIRGKYDQMMDNELKYQESLRRQDADKYMQYLEGKEERDREMKKNRLNDILSTNVAYDELDQDLQEEYASMLGYTATEARRSWDHKVATQLIAKEQAEAERERENTRFAWEEENREISANQRKQAEVAMENELRAQGWEYIKSPDELGGIDKSKFDVIAIKQPDGPDKLYKAPKGMSELEVYEAKKQIDAKYRVASGEKADPVREMTQELTAVTGPDGYVSPENYAIGRKAWVDAGLNPTEYDTKMKGFRNPNNKNYITDTSSNSSSGGRTP